jgi:hypothetical protein
MWVVLEYPNVFSSQNQGNILKRGHDICDVLPHDMSCNTEFLSQLVSSTRCHMWPAVCLPVI